MSPKNKIADLKAAHQKTRQEIEAIKIEMKKIYDLYIEGGINAERFKILNQPLEDRLTEQNQTLAKLEGETTATEVTELNAEVIAAEGKTITSVWPQLDTEGKLRLVSLLCSEIIIPSTDPEAPIDITLNTRLEPTI